MAPSLAMNRQTFRSLPGFTLIELLTVITIIAILMAMLFPFVFAIKETARQRKADQDIRVIVNAVQNFHVDYGQYPAVDPNSNPQNTGDTACGDKAAQITIDNANLFNILRDINKAPNDNHALNPRQQKYIETHVVSNPASPRDGFLEVAGGGAGVAGSWYDPWGNQYCVVIDTNGDNLIEVSKFYTDFKDEKAPRGLVGAFSLGRDQKLGKNGDQTYKKDQEYSDDRVSWTSH
jgi:prepilin-type N-terminal cleavage/methylation domain-containing protein